VRAIYRNLIVSCATAMRAGLSLIEASDLDRKRLSAVIKPTQYRFPLKR